MNIVISKEIFKATTKCSSRFSCLSRVDKKDLCQVESVFAGKIHFVQCLYDKHCAYQRPFEYGLFCTCPIRKEIYNTTVVATTRP